MKLVNSDDIYQAVSKKLVELNTQVNDCVFDFFQKYEGPFKKEILANFEIAKKSCIPLCQDTGIVEFFVWKGFEVLTNEPITKILNSVVRNTYIENGFRKSVVEDPLFERKNTNDNTPCVVHFFEVENPILEIWILIKGGGSENLSMLYMFEPSEKYEIIKDTIVNHINMNGPNACPPIRIGIGIGGTSDEALLLSKLALIDESIERLNTKITRYKTFEMEIFDEVQKLRIGVQGLGVGGSLYNVRAYGYPTHIATLPVAVAVDCYLVRSTKVVILND
ncbi:MAG: fumarate hydratase [Fervidobacterium sp.]|nr:fumarate hydratase [Fervidobacterium sp.]